MEGLVNSRRWKNLKQRIGFRVIGCCGAAWSPRLLPTLNITGQSQSHTEEDNDEVNIIITNVNVGSGQVPVEHRTITRNSVDRHQTTNNNPTASGMNLRTALQAERNLRPNMGPTENVKTLMRLIEETDGVDWKSGHRKSGDVESGEEGGGGGGSDWVCCVCMKRNKGAAFIPCGHTFCRVCSREMWVNRGSCPICNHSILEILDIF